MYPGLWPRVERGARLLEQQKHSSVLGVNVISEKKSKKLGSLRNQEVVNEEKYFGGTNGGIWLGDYWKVL